MKKISAVFNKIFDFLELYLSGINFIIVFISFVILILYRYIFFKQMGWLFELNAIAFVWSGVLAASYGGRSEKHVMFTVIYDKVSEKTKLIFRIIGNIFIFATFFMLLPSTYESIDFLKIRETAVMKIPTNYVYLPFLIFIILTLIHYFVLLINDIRHLKNMVMGRTIQ